MRADFLRKEILEGRLDSPRRCEAELEASLLRAFHTGVRASPVVVEQVAEIAEAGGRSPFQERPPMATLDQRPERIDRIRDLPDSAALEAVNREVETFPAVRAANPTRAVIRTTVAFAELAAVLCRCDKLPSAIRAAEITDGVMPDPMMEPVRAAVLRILAHVDVRSGELERADERLFEASDLGGLTFGHDLTVALLMYRLDHQDESAALLGETVSRMHAAGYSRLARVTWRTLQLGATK